MWTSPMLRLGINLLREGLDLPEVSLVAILDADKEGFLRSEISLIQTVGRAARNVDGKVIMYADKITRSMKRAIDETQRRREIQEQYNLKHNIKPRSIEKGIRDVIEATRVAEEEDKYGKAAIKKILSIEELEKIIKGLEKEMMRAAKDLQFERAAELRDKIESFGGKVIGGGNYPVGGTVTLTALPDEGYVFSGWTVAGVTVKNPNSAVISFVMPDMGNVTAHAVFKTSSQEEPDGDGDSYKNKDQDDSEESDDGRDSYKNKDQDDSYVPPVMTSIYSPAGDIVKIEIPADANPNTTVPFYLAADGSRIYVAMSAVFDGTLYFRAPIDGEYYIVDNCPAFTDTKGHWAEPSMEFMAARMLFVGTGENLFEPDVPVTRAMFITVLHRIAGKPEPNRPAAFSDVPPGIWYEKAAAWGNENGIILDADRVAQGKNYAFPERDTEDRDGHGTATAGMMLGSSRLGVEGSCPDAGTIAVTDTRPGACTFIC